MLNNWLQQLRSNWRMYLPVFLLGVLLGHSLLQRPALPEQGMQVDFINTSDVAIESIQLDFGHAAGQSSLLLLRLPAGASRSLLLNHQPGAGFNLQVRYADGVQQEFCANRGVQGQYQQVRLTR